MQKALTIAAEEFAKQNFGNLDIIKKIFYDRKKVMRKMAELYRSIDKDVKADNLEQILQLSFVAQSLRETAEIMSEIAERNISLMEKFDFYKHKLINEEKG